MSLYFVYTLTIPMFLLSCFFFLCTFWPSSIALSCKFATTITTVNSLIQNTTSYVLTSVTAYRTVNHSQKDHPCVRKSEGFRSCVLASPEYLYIYMIDNMLITYYMNRNPILWLFAIVSR